MKQRWAIETRLKDGFYRISRSNFTAGFEVRNGRVVACAPILRRLIKYWVTVAEPLKRHGNHPKNR